MAQRSIILGFEPRLIGNFVAIFKVIKAIQFQCFFKQIQQLRFCIGFVNFKNLQKRKGIRLGPLFSNQISLVTLRFLFTISGQTKFLILFTFYPVHSYSFSSLWTILYNPIKYLLIKSDDIHNYIHTFEYFERKDKIGLWSWLKPSKIGLWDLVQTPKNRSFSHGSNS